MRFARRAGEHCAACPVCSPAASSSSVPAVRRSHSPALAYWPWGGGCRTRRAEARPAPPRSALCLTRSAPIPHMRSPTATRWAAVLLARAYATGDEPLRRYADAVLDLYRARAASTPRLGTARPQAAHSRAGRLRRCTEGGRAVGRDARGRAARGLTHDRLLGLSHEHLHPQVPRHRAVRPSSRPGPTLASHYAQPGRYSCGGRRCAPTTSHLRLWADLADATASPAERRPVRWRRWEGTRRPGRRRRSPTGMKLVMLPYRYGRWVDGDHWHIPGGRGVWP